MLNQYADLGVAPEYKRFDPNLQQALAWLRFINGIATEEDYEWMRHEYVKQKYELENQSNYQEAHEHAQKRYNGHPWSDNWKYSDDYEQENDDNEL